MPESLDVLSDRELGINAEVVGESDVVIDLCGWLARRATNTLSNPSLKLPSLGKYSRYSWGM